MKNENEKKGLFARINDNKRKKKNSCCCNFEVEEIPDKDKEKDNAKKSPKGKGNSCC